ncbi:hypothetical protein OOT00_07165 [Desulfobotulus sp. H1]|uniref:Uncharacterized protein n=1 Tax=Desulfobotulus pelophilus TaxID=2823377 RepID=A0ABT3N8H6_9BACT|nr:hypothetical protein [Desulfobotulus pelophilus]MCW7753759.1 hypothetical protein [Desulfobotulus pelophilus]
MKIPPYWVKTRYEGQDDRGQTHRIVASGWSFVSLNEAREEAVARAKRIFERLMGGERLDRYEYHDVPVKEEILRQITHDGKTIALITRNRYGAEVLNCNQVLFVDVDFPKARPLGFWAALGGLFRKQKNRNSHDALIHETTQGVISWSDRNSDHGFRLYRTKEGLRLLFTDRLHDPISPQTEALLKELHADPLYGVLTRKQQCFRARLTSKPWRCNCPNPPSAFPWEDKEKEKEYRDWQLIYEKKNTGFRTCEFVGEFGKKNMVSQARSIMEIHDRETGVRKKCPLA